MTDKKKIKITEGFLDKIYREIKRNNQVVNTDNKSFCAVIESAMKKEIETVDSHGNKYKHIRLKLTLNTKKNKSSYNNIFILGSKKLIGLFNYGPFGSQNFSTNDSGSGDKLLKKLLKNKKGTIIRITDYRIIRHRSSFIMIIYAID